jgi:hypothetical protein
MEKPLIQRTELATLEPSGAVAKVNPVNDPVVVKNVDIVRTPAMDLDTGLNSFLIRDTLSVPLNVAGDTLLKTYILPRDLLSPEPDWRTNIQDATFQQFLLLRPAGEHFMEVQINTNGNPFCSGRIFVSYRPLVGTITPEFSFTSTIANDVPAESQMIDISRPASVTIRIPFTNHREYLNTIASTEFDENLGTLTLRHLGCSGPPTQAVTVTIWTRYNVHPTMLRPRLAPAVWFKANGGGSSKHETNILNTYIQSSVGTNATEYTDTSTQSATGAQVDANLEATIPMDAVPLVGGYVPTLAQNPDLNLILSPVTCRVFGTENASESRHNAGRDFRTTTDPLNVTHAMNLKHSMKLGTSLDNLVAGAKVHEFEFTLNPAIGPIPLQAMLSRYRYWKADALLIDVEVFGTASHNLALRSVFTPLAPSAVNLAESSTQFNNFTQFGAEKRSMQLRIPFCAATEWLKVPDLEREAGFATDRVQDYSCGWLTIWMDQPVQVPTVTNIGTLTMDINYSFEGLQLGGLGMRSYGQLARVGGAAVWYEAITPVALVPTDEDEEFVANGADAAEAQALKDDTADNGPTWTEEPVDIVPTTTPPTPVPGPRTVDCESTVPFAHSTLLLSYRRPVTVSPQQLITFHADYKMYPAPNYKIAPAPTGVPLSVGTRLNLYSYEIDPIPIPAMIARGGVNFHIFPRGANNSIAFAFIGEDNEKVSPISRRANLVSLAALTGRFHGVALSTTGTDAGPWWRFAGSYRTGAVDQQSIADFAETLPSQDLTMNVTNVFRVTDSSIFRWHALDGGRRERLMIVAPPNVTVQVMWSISDDYRVAYPMPDVSLDTPAKVLDYYLAATDTEAAQPLEMLFGQRIR